MTYTLCCWGTLLLLTCNMLQSSTSLKISSLLSWYTLCCWVSSHIRMSITRCTVPSGYKVYVGTLLATYFTLKSSAASLALSICSRSLALSIFRSSTFKKNPESEKLDGLILTRRAINVWFLGPGSWYSHWSRVGISLTMSGGIIRALYVTFIWNL